MSTQSVALPAHVSSASSGVFLPAFTLWWRELVRFYRQRTRVIGVIASPLLFWLVIGSGFGTSFRSGNAPGQQHYLDYFYPGALIMIVLFTSIFTMMSVIEDRKEGFLLSVLVAPVPRSAIRSLRNSLPTEQRSVPFREMISENSADRVRSTQATGAGILYRLAPRCRRLALQCSARTAASL